ncbi:hypothetical protein [Microcystis phage Mel-JY01]
MSDLIKKEVRYLARDFASLKNDLINFSKNYFPNTYQDFNEASPGMMFLELAAYVGDVLSYYTDVNLQESLLLQAAERENIMNIAQSLGYKPKNSIASTVKLDLFITIPSKNVSGEIVPDYSYAPSIEPGMVVASTATNSNSRFRTIDYVDFRYSSSLDPTTVLPYEVDDSTGEITYWLLKKSVSAISGEIKTKTFTFEDPKPYDKVAIEDPNLIEILYGVDSDGNKWFNVPYLAQDTIFEPTPNIPRNDTHLSVYRDETPYLLKLRKITRRFVVRQTHHDLFEIQFGAGVSNLDDELLIPNPDLVGNSLTGIDTSVSADIDPSNFLYTKTYGLAPNNTNITIYYTVGGGYKDNVPSNTLTRVLSKKIVLDNTGLDSVLYNQVITSLAVDNPAPATGGKQKEDDNEIRQNALAHFASQNRAVTKEDYIIRAYSLPQKYGSIAKAYITKDTQIVNGSISDRVSNDLALNFYVLGFDGNQKLTPINDATKENLKTYLNYHRILTDAVNIKDAYIINIGVEFDIITLPDQNGNQVLLRCIDRLKKYFNVGRWQINQPIILSNIFSELDKVEGVQTVVNVKVINKHDDVLGYSRHAYNIEQATKDGIIFPSLDPSIFEVKFPENDIIGRVRSFG